MTLKNKSTDNIPDRQWQLIKIYGAQRTGTNYLAWLLSFNFTNVIVLQNMLGSKHGAPNKPLLEILDEWEKRPKGYIVNSDRKLYLNGKRLDPEGDKVALRTDYIRDQIEKEQIRFIVIFREPYEWAARYAWFYSKNRPYKVTDNLERVKAAVENRFNVYYQPALDNLKKEHTIFIRLDYIKNNPCNFLDIVQQRFDCGDPRYIGPLKRMRAGFDHDFRKAKESMQDLKDMGKAKTLLSARCWDYVRDNLNWDTYKQLEERFKDDVKATD